MKIRNKEIKNSSVIKPKKNLTAILIIGIIVILIGTGLFFALSKMFETETYYVVATDVPAKTQLTPAMLIPQETAKDTAPKNAISLAEIQQGTLYTKYQLYQGDVISRSNSGEITNSYDGIPDDWVVTSFTVNSDLAADGSIRRGDYFDIIGIISPNQDIAGNYLVTDVLCLDVNSAAASSEDEGETRVTSAALTYTVGMPQELAPAVLASLQTYETIRLVRSPLASRYEKRDIEGLSDPVIINPGDEILDLYENTDPTLTPVVRDKEGRPVNQKNCDENNVNPKNLCEIHGFTKKSSKSNDEYNDDNELDSQETQSTDTYNSSK